MRCTIPELNPETDVYRIGTLLELMRELAFTFADDGKRVKVRTAWSSLWLVSVLISR